MFLMDATFIGLQLQLVQCMVLLIRSSSSFAHGCIDAPYAQNAFAAASSGAAYCAMISLLRSPLQKLLLVLAQQVVRLVSTN